MDVEIIMVDDEEKEETKSYIDSQLNNYIDKLNSNENFNNIVKPNTTDSYEWINYLKSIKLYSDEIKCTAEWLWVSALFDQTYFIFQEVRRNKDLNKEAKRKYIKQTLEKTIPTRSTTQSNRYKQVYDHIIDLVTRFESEKIPIEIWLPVLGKICISFRFLHESNFKRKKTYKLYEKFIKLLISKCLISIIKFE
ncbi:6829_t:CDS:1 [Dentiscutata heterogama]|uniref:6829_t:CDS:1 n=1 Tax=Dentiscutata heterogama TaxID=1316150 RepID=A0ACA9K505_9GLOM|nr:6829_t:CDS:1 [Dentiscutata heterogama]